MKISLDTSNKILRRLKYNFDPHEFNMGINSELEHKNVTHGNLVMTAKIAAAHLNENPKYYSLLKKYVEKNEDGMSGGVGLNLPGGSINGAPNPKDVKKMRKQLNTENVMIKLSDILLEAGKERRIVPTRLIIALEKVMPCLSTSNETQISELLTRVLEGIGKVNQLPYNYQTMATWKITHLAEVDLPVNDLRQKLTAILEKPNKTIDTEAVRLAIKAIDELYIL